MTINSVTFKGQTFTRNGKAYSHVVITTSAHTVYDGAPRPLVEWASTEELAVKNQNGHFSRAAKVAKGDKIGAVYSTDYYRRFVDSVIVKVDHPEVAPAKSDEAATRSANRTDGDDVIDAEVEVVSPKVDETDAEDAPVVAQDEPEATPATDAEKAAKVRAQWAKNKRASRARLAAKKKEAQVA